MNELGLSGVLLNLKLGPDLRHAFYKESMTFEVVGL